MNKLKRLRHVARKRGKHMTIIVCIDDRGGMLFHGRRQSRDRLLCEDMLRTCGRIWMNAYSAALFPENGGKIRVDEAFLSRAGPDDACFVENMPLDGVVWDRLILYRWNRAYPGDVFLGFRPEERGMILDSVETFPGSSHEKITKEIWRMDNGETQNT